MNRIRPHGPAFCEGFEREAVEFETVEQLLAIPFVAGCTEPVEWPFHRFSLSETKLVAEYDQGRHWWVVGFIERPEDVSLPRWDAAEAMRLRSAIDIDLAPMAAGEVEIGCRLTVSAGVVGLLRKTG